MYKAKANVRQLGIEIVTCGWGSVTVDDPVENPNINAKHSVSLHCMPVILYSIRTCNSILHTKNFTNKLLCGEAPHGCQRTTWVIILKIFWVIIRCITLLSPVFDEWL